MNLTPSIKIVAGANKTKDISVIIEKRVMLSKESCTRQCFSRQYTTVHVYDTGEKNIEEILQFFQLPSNEKHNIHKIVNEMHMS